MNVHGQPVQIRKQLTADESELIDDLRKLHPQDAAQIHGMVRAWLSLPDYQKRRWTNDNGR